MIIAYSLNITDNDSYMYGSGSNLFETLTKLHICSSCGYRKSLNWDNPLFELKKSYFDFSYTYDGICIVSQKVRDFIFRFHYENDIELVKLKNFSDFYTFLPRRSVAFDSVRRKTKFKNLCKVCGFYESITGATPVFLKDGFIPLYRGFYKTDLQFGSGNEKSPILLVSPQTKKELISEKFTGITFQEVNL
ncbi:hypothetical protein LEP1GSC041_4411 [Leptospira noguchii str. 2006001870]|uniref:Uncharacterized protein n=2 Tax=Leptospira noguchii TaxID=28182 RepID=T0FMU5_9LEPT|nr:hypothetical protein LEP1GSC041_4411 [Leptospira noguchii str. 2006001870]EQA70875.1 hypothetical protein LEP1GSC059_3534 [Leptospira noguchii serovar Panama str. CZ214]